MIQATLELRSMAVDLVSSDEKSRQAIGSEIKRLIDEISRLHADELTRLRSDLAATRAELEAQREINDGVHRAICELCGLSDEATVYAVKSVVDQGDAAIAEAEALRAEKKQYRDRAIALRNQARAWRNTVYKTVLLD